MWKTNISCLSAILFVTSCAQAAIAPDRTRLVYKGGEKSISVTLKNDSQTLPYLAQTWVENEKGEKITSPLAVLPPVQRIEAKTEGQVKVQGMPDISTLAQDKETLFYFNVREIPPKSDKPNSLQIALQTRIKLFYRPAALAKKVDPEHPWQHQVTLSRQGEHYLVKNPTSYYVIISSASTQKGGQPITGFEPLVMPPATSQEMKGRASDLGSAPVLTYVNDYGGRLPLYFQCSSAECHVDGARSSKG
ncbi:fimbria/pilus periplasmic chaperone [Escherichia marmotae]|nr:fimbria/pilus periplasmic chaperone [Escherichia marmotae]MED9481674.1 fimbria/pilus periplasmic chaperone [Escherichia marmotae]